MADPIHQFEINKIFTLTKVGAHEIAFTNSALFMAITVVGVAALLIGGRDQSKRLSRCQRDRDPYGAGFGSRFGRGVSLRPVAGLLNRFGLYAAVSAALVVVWAVIFLSSSRLSARSLLMSFHTR